jgi:hypothetical protein
LARPAVSSERDGHPFCAAHLGRERGAADQRRAAADDAVGPKHTFVEVGYMHRTALAAAQAFFLAEDFEHHPLHVAALGDAVPVTAVGARHVVLVVQVRADAGGYCLLTSVQVHEARDIAGCELGMQPFFELPDRSHYPVRVEQALLAKLLRAGNLCHTASFPLRALLQNNHLAALRQG